MKKIIYSIIVIQFFSCTHKFANNSESDNRKIASEDYENTYNILSDLDTKDAATDNTEKVCRHVAGIHRPPPNKKVVLTFDDGPSKRNTRTVLDILKRYNIKATFFMLGNSAEKNIDIVKAVVEQGHIIGNHSYDHPTFALIPEDKQDQEMNQAADILKPYMDKQSIKLFRFPYGSSSCHAIDHVVKDLKYDGSLGWHVDTCDWAFEKHDTVTNPKAIQDCDIKPQNLSSYHDHVMYQLRSRGGGIILMHETNDKTVATLEDIIKTLISEGYEFTNMDQPEMQNYQRVEP